MRYKGMDYSSRDISYHSKKPGMNDSLVKTSILQPIVLIF